MPNFTPELLAFLGLAVLWVLERSLKMLKHRGIDLPKMSRQMDRLDKLWNDRHMEYVKDKLDLLYDLHNVRGEDGVPVWYVRASDQRALNDALNALAESSKAQTILLQAMLLEIKEQRNESGKAHEILLGSIKKD